MKIQIKKPENEEELKDAIKIFFNHFLRQTVRKTIAEVLISNEFLNSAGAEFRQKAEEVSIKLRQTEEIELV